MKRTTMKQTTMVLTALVTMVAFLFVATTIETQAQRRQSVTTEPSHKKGDPCEDKTESNVTKTPWKLSGLGFLRVSSTPVDTVLVASSANQLLNAVGGNVENYQAIVDTIQGWMNGYSFVGYSQWTRTVTTTIKEWKCVDGVLKLVRNETKTFDEKTPWIQFGPFNWNEMTVKKLRSEIEKGKSGLPKE